MHTESTEMHLITVYRLTRQSPHASTKDVAAMLGVSAPSASERIKRLTAQGYLNHEWREGTTLTAEGERIALNVLRKHRLAETFLVNLAGYALNEVHEEACQMEHAISDRLADRLEALLGYPKLDPHGHPIPTKEGTVATLSYPTLAEMSVGQSLTVQQITDWDEAQLSYLCELGLIPGAELLIQEIAPFDGPMTLLINDKTIALAQNLAQHVYVQLK
jgi:DtxR family Mn-dependent transcriptional regulator